MTTENEEINREMRIIDLGKANVFALWILFTAVVLFGGIYYWVWPDQFSSANIKQTIKGPVWAAIVVPIVGIFVHELLHGITWSFFAKKRHKSIKYGILKKYYTPYCHCREPLKVKHYVTGALMPGIVLGFLPAAISIITGKFSLLLLGIFFIAAAAGDFMIVWLLKKEKADSMVLDHPSEAGFYIYKNGNAL